MSLDVQSREKLAIFEIIFGPFENLEWSGEVRGPGSGPMFSGGDGERYAACPVCRGLKEPNGAFVKSAVGHQPGCRLAAALGKPERPLENGEQGSIPL